MFGNKWESINGAQEETHKGFPTQSLAGFWSRLNRIFRAIRKFMKAISLGRW